MKMAEESLCASCIYGHYMETTYIHRKEMNEIVSGSEEEPREAWQSSIYSDKEEPEDKEVEMFFSYCYYPTPVLEAQKQHEYSTNEFHDVVVTRCNLYKRFEV